MRVRDWWLSTHKWLGLAVALFFAIAAFTGGVLVYEHELQQGRPGTAGIVTGVLLDPRNGEVLQVRDPRKFEPAVRVARVHNFNVHVGRFGGAPVRVLYAMVCFTGAALALSGVLMWWLKREKLLGSSARRDERAEVRA